MPRSRLAICIDILREGDSVPKKASRLASAMGGRLRLDLYLDFLTSKGYLAVNGDRLYACTPQGRKALVAYDSLQVNGFSTGDEGIRENDLAVLREVGDTYMAKILREVGDTYMVKISRYTFYGIRKRLKKRGLIIGKKPTEEGKRVLELAADLFGLVDDVLSI